MPNDTLTAQDVMQAGPVIPVLVIDDVQRAVPLAKALLAGGIKVLEITLRTPCALEAIERIATDVPDAIVGAGTVTTPQQFREAEQAGARFIISPGIQPALLEQARGSKTPFIPGIATVSELMTAMEYGVEDFKFFPAEVNGGTKALKAIGGPFPGVSFCPTGGISPDNVEEYLSLDNVTCVGGSWLAPAQLVEAEDYDEITRLAKTASALPG